MTALGALETAVMHAMFTLARQDGRINGWDDLDGPLQGLRAADRHGAGGGWMYDFRMRKNFDTKEDVRKIVSRLRTKVSAAGVQASVIERLLPRPAAGQPMYPSHRLQDVL